MSVKLWRSQEEEWTSNYYITRVKTGSRAVWRLDELETRCGRESQHPAEWALRPRIEQLQLERRCWIEEHVPETLGPKPPVELPRRTRKNVVMAIRVGVNMLQFCSVSNSLSHKTLSNKVRGIFFQRTVSLVFIVSLWFCMHAYVYVYI